jgi:uncharacterized membrane protein YhaH (DUF805 family)
MMPRNLGAIMFKSKLGRRSFFVYSALVTIMEVGLVTVCVAGTIGIEKLIESMPGPEREGMAFAFLGVSVLGVLLFAAIVRGNLAWRRAKDSQGSKWLVWQYVVFSLFLAFVYAGAFLSCDFDNPLGEPQAGGIGIVGILAICVFIMWGCIFMPPSIEKCIDPAIKRFERT